MSYEGSCDCEFDPVFWRCRRTDAHECAAKPTPPEVPAPDDGDRPLPEDDAIKAAHPTRTGRHDLYAEAMRMVGAKHSKGALVDLVNWLLYVRAREGGR